MKSQPIKIATFGCLYSNVGLVFLCPLCCYCVLLVSKYCFFECMKNNQNVGNIFQEKPARYVVYCNKFINLVQSAYITLG